MQISVSGHHVQITEAIEQYIRKKLRRLEKHYQPIINSQVILTVDKNVQKAETRIHISGAEVFAEAESNNLYTSIDKMVKKLLPEFYNEALYKMSDTVVVTKKKQTLDRKNNHQSETDQKILFEFGIVTISNGVDYIFSIISRSSSENIVTCHTEYAENNPAFERSNKVKKPPCNMT